MTITLSVPPYILKKWTILLYGCTNRTLTKRLEKKLDGNYTRMLRAILNKSRWQNATRHQLYDYLPPIMKTIQVRWTRHAGHCWRSRDELISDVLLWTPTYGQAKAGWPAQTYIQQLCEDTGCGPEHLPEAMNDTEKWWERFRDIHAWCMTWWWWLILWIHLWECLNTYEKIWMTQESLPDKDIIGRKLLFLQQLVAWLVSLFNDISIFVSHLMSKLSLERNTDTL